MTLIESSKSNYAPVLVIAFNRAGSTRQVIQALIDSGVQEIYFAVDGPREFSIEDKIRVAEVRNLVLEFGEAIQFHTLIRPSNLGCRLAVTEAITWFFSQVDRGIILEDDCVPSSDFIVFSSRMLEKYKENESIMHVGGSSYLGDGNNYPYNHYFTSFHEVWGWATWGRAWKHFQIDPGSTSEEENSLLLNHFKSKKITKWFMGYLEQARTTAPSVWSTQWSLSIIKNHGIAVNPINNLVSNIGFNSDSTHGSNDSFRHYNSFQVSALSSLPDPEVIKINYRLDKRRFAVIRRTDPSLFLWNKVKRSSREKSLRVLPIALILSLRKLKKNWKSN